MMKNKINIYRNKIDNIDDKLLSLVIERMGIVQEMSEIKKSLGIATFISEREIKILNRLTNRKNKQLNEKQITELFEVIFKTDKKVQHSLASRDFKKENSIIKVNDLLFGGDENIIIGGPCAVESEEQMFKITESLVDCGIKMIRGGAYKPRTSPYSFQGLGVEGLKILKKCKEKYGVSVISEIVDKESAEKGVEYLDMLQIGTRNMQNYELLKIVGSLNKPVLLKRGMSATLEETLLAVEYLLMNGCKDIVVCERGIRSFSTHNRNVLDVGFVSAWKRESHLPIIIDPSHASGKKDSVLSHALSGIAAGADGMIVECHNNPSEALSDGHQALLPDDFPELVNKSNKIYKLVRENE